MVTQSYRGLRDAKASQLPNQNLPANCEILGGNMFTFIIGLFTGSFIMLFIMSLMFAAKRGDIL
jgi:hypothetical protein